MTIQETLKKYFGYDSFRGGQEELIRAILQQEDALGIMPTGAGKSICFQLPGIMMQGVTLVVSPLISLMQDQVRALIQSGIPAAYINSSLSYKQVQTALYNAQNGQYKLIYVAPERLMTADFLEFAQHTSISMLTVDEAHCISQWGQDFRPSYAEIPEFIKRLPERPIVSAFTATATKRVKEDIIELLKLKNPRILVTGFNRENLYFEVQEPADKRTALLSFLQENQHKNGIVYCSTRKNVEEVCEMLTRHGYSALRYHAGLSDRERKQNQEEFLYDKAQIMVATNAFGMGIDKSNVNFVVHYNMPKDIESYYQEAGRAGRDGSSAVCLMLYSGQDVMMNRWMIENARDTDFLDEEIAKHLKEQEYKRLRDITFYARTTDCLRGYILRYFGESPSSFCGNCSNCGSHFETIEVTEEAQKILSCIVRMDERFGAGMVIDVLRGSENKRIKEWGFDRLSTYNISRKRADELKNIIDFLVQNGYLKTEGEPYSVLRLTPKAKEVLQGKIQLKMKLPKEKEQKVKKLSSAEGLPLGREDLFAKLKALRQQIASVLGVPAFVVFTDKTLIEICVKLPLDNAQFLSISGVGEEKLKRYGERFLNLIIDYCEEQNTLTLEEKKADKVDKKKRRPLQELILPTDEVIKKISIFEEPSQVSLLVKEINRVLEENNCTRITSVKVCDWLVSKGYLRVSEEEGKRAKVPTEKGFTAGITQERRESQRGVYQVNLYSPSLQQWICNSIAEIQKFSKKAIEQEISVQEDHGENE